MEWIINICGVPTWSLKKCKLLLRKQIFISKFIFVFCMREQVNLSDNCDRGKVLTVLSCLKVV